VTSPTASYSAADQTTDFGGAQSSVDVKIYQLSAVIGRGYTARANICGSQYLDEFFHTVIDERLAITMNVLLLDYRKAKFLEGWTCCDTCFGIKTINVLPCSSLMNLFNQR